MIWLQCSLFCDTILDQFLSVNKFKTRCKLFFSSSETVSAVYRTVPLWQKLLYQDLCASK